MSSKVIRFPKQPQQSHPSEGWGVRLLCCIIYGTLGLACSNVRLAIQLLLPLLAIIYGVFIRPNSARFPYLLRYHSFQGLVVFFVFCLTVLILTEFINCLYSLLLIAQQTEMATFIELTLQPWLNQGVVLASYTIGGVLGISTLLGQTLQLPGITGIVRRQV
ncbi:MAG: hypothetical protein K2X01_08600 [Cyanobacteria bacterium]|nr:hypothetical protein [Cyanobacteriota bacterium]